MHGETVRRTMAPADGGDGDVGARRAEVAARLLERGISARVLQALLPGWDEAIAAAAPARPTDGA